MVRNAASGGAQLLEALLGFSRHQDLRLTFRLQHTVDRTLHTVTSISDDITQSRRSPAAAYVINLWVQLRALRKRGSVVGDASYKSLCTHIVLVVHMHFKLHVLFSCSLHIVLRTCTCCIDVHCYHCTLGRPLICVIRSDSLPSKSGAKHAGFTTI